MKEKPAQLTGKLVVTSSWESFPQRYRCRPKQSLPVSSCRLDL